MPRTARPGARLHAVCERLVQLIDEYLRMSDQELASFLGYKNTSTLWKARRFRAFIDVHRLQRLAQLRVGRMRPNIDWLITGEGSPLVSVAPLALQLQEAAAALAGLGPDEQRAVLLLSRGRRRDQ